MREQRTGVHIYLNSIHVYFFCRDLCKCGERKWIEKKELIFCTYFSHIFLSYQKIKKKTKTTTNYEGVYRLCVYICTYTIFFFFAPIAVYLCARIHIYIYISTCVHNKIMYRYRENESKQHF